MISYKTGSQRSVPGLTMIYDHGKCSTGRAVEAHCILHWGAAEMAGSDWEVSMVQMS